jgi:pimeloyl-ACP methyl ester carboxylesterase
MPSIFLWQLDYPHASDRSSRSDDLVRAVALIAANVGHAPRPPVVREAIRASADPALADTERLAALSFAFFAPSNNTRAWLACLHPDALVAQCVAGDRTSREEDFAAGPAPILYLQKDHDTLAHVEDVREFKRALGDRATIMVIRNCSHAAIVEQPDAIGGAVIDYADGLWPKDRR